MRLDLILRKLKYYDLGPSGLDHILCNELLTVAQNLNQCYAAEVCIAKQQAVDPCLCSVYMSLQHTLSRETTVLVYMQKFSEGRGAVAFTAWKMHVERVTVKLKVCLLENKSQNMALQGLTPVVLNCLVR